MANPIKGPSMRTATLWMLVARQKRAQRILELKADGCTWAEIAEIVRCSVRTVRGIYAAEIRIRKEIEQYRRTNAGQ